ncbi:putative monodehydroascorbate reductase, cytoplasmic isoform 2 [Tetrabaena socialis]|uniref:monodehydroascorbate reductase (NADH) n=1 Tax=Tetrabaena socialis TaxID=47790 RepID=A0A2J8A8Z7_9CHLO|nr:putative monodehydroascorbate reductase, cytoplasmic isoform 2 [Tetrabaena socialis]|eukprot:PNH08943.1 putative monodehydroascorbate reductase, cytoplasmic isoform 2 [Tetrabaena socialis]
MAPIAYKYVILGGGNAAGYAARALVEGGLKAGELAIIGEEPYVCYERPALSKGYLLGQARLPGFHTCVGGGGERQTPEWYTDKGISFHTSSRVTSTDLAARTLLLASGEAVAFEKLIIATGARAVVVGGGYIGMECAAGLAANGLSVSIVMPDDRLLSRLLTPQLAAVYERLYSEKGVATVKGASVTGFQGAGGKVTGVEYKEAAGGGGGVLEAALVVVGVGARPNVELFAGQLELAAGGIKVDDQMATSASAGRPSPSSGPSASTTPSSARHDGAAGPTAPHSCRLSPPPYDYLPYFYSRIFALAWVFYGEAPPAATTLHFGDLQEAKTFGCLWLGEGGALVGAFLEGGSAEEAAVLKAAVTGRVAVAAEGLEAASTVDVLAALRAKA